MLKRRFSAFHLLFLSVNGTIGSAWLFAPLYAARLAGPAVIWAWIFCGLATCLIAFTFAELSAMIPVAGGTTRFAQLSHGVLTGYIISWISWLSCVTMAPIEVQAVLQYASTYFPSLIYQVNGIPELTRWGLLWALVLMLGLSFVNFNSFKGLVRWNLVLFWFKVLVIVATIGLIIHARFIPSNFHGMHDFMLTGDWHGVLAAIATGGIAFAFTGFKHGVELAGESKNTQLSIPLAILGSVVICLLLYLGLQIAFLGSLLPQSFANGWAQLHFAGDVGPFVGIAAALGLVWLVKFLYIDAAISPLGAGLVYTTSTARLIYAMSRNGYLPGFLSKVNKESLPIAAIALNFIVGMFLFLPLPGWQIMVSFLVSAVVISYAMGPIALVALRRSLPNRPRPFKLWCAYPLCLIAFYFCNLISYWTGWDTIWRLAIAVVVGLVILLIALLRGRTSLQQMGFRAMAWLVPYLIGLVVISYLGSFGGKNLIPFGWDFLVIGVFTIVIFCLAIVTSARSIDPQQITVMEEAD